MFQGAFYGRRDGGRQLADSSLLRAALRELPAESPARSLIVAEIQELES